MSSAPITAPLLAKLVADKEARETQGPVEPLSPAVYDDLTRAMLRGYVLAVGSVQDAVEQFSEEELIAADLECDRNKAFKAHRAQERNAMRLQMNDKSGFYS